MRSFPTYRITVELIVPGSPQDENDYLQLRAWDQGRTVGPLAFGPNSLSRISIDVQSHAISLWLASRGQNFYDGPWNPDSARRRAVPGDFGLMDPGLSEV
jgi:hypothetical protein